MENTKHACMLQKPPSYDDLHPTASCWQRIRNRWRNLLLPCEWHHGSLVFLRSRKSLQLERQRHLQSGYWFVSHPYSPAKHYWDTFIWLVCACADLYIPLEVFRPCPNPADPIILAVDFLALCDIIFIFCSGYIDEGNKEIVLEPKKIALNYLKGNFIITFIAVWPWQLYEPFSDCRYPSHTVFLTIKLLKWKETKEKLSRILEQFRFSYSSTVFFTVTIRLLIFFQWMAYWQYQVPVLCTHYYDLNNLGKAEAQWFKRLQVDHTTKPILKYITSLYYVFGRCIGTGYERNVKYHVKPEMIQNCITSIVSLIFLVYCFMIVLRLTMSSQNHYFVFDGAMKDLEKYMTMKRLPKSLQQKIQLFINYKFGGSYTDEVAILNTINEQIKKDINMHTCRRLVLAIPLFKGFPIALINALIFSLKREACIPGQEVIKCGRPSECLYFIYYGTVAVADENGKEIKHLNDDAYFGEAAILYPDAVATTTVTALEITELYALNNKDFEACIQPYSQIKERLADNYRRSLHVFLGRQ